MGQREAPAAQHQRRQRGQQRLAAAVGLQPAIVREQQAVQRLRHGPGFRRGVVVDRQRLQCQPRRQATVGALADAIGEGEQVTLAGSQRRRRGGYADGILVFRPRPGGAGLGKAQAQTARALRLIQGNGLVHTRAAVTAALPQVVRQRFFTPCRPNQASTPRLANSQRPS
ncbi:hypothetical protein D3C81_1400920 [compost metagenome]